MTKNRKKTITIRDVADRAGVSIATVSRYINHNTPLSEKTSERVHEAMVELKFTPYTLARRLATNKNHALGLLVSNLSGDFFAPMFRGVEQVATDAGFDLIVSTSSRIGARKDHPLPLGPHNTDGLLVFWDSLSAEQIRQISEEGFPIVLIHQSPPEGLQVPCVTVENQAASKRIVDHLLEVHNRRRIVLVAGPAGNEDSQWRESGYRLALEDMHIPVEPKLIIRGDYDQRIAGQAIRKLIEDRVPFDGVFACDDESAVGVLEALDAAGRRVPEDVSLVGFDDQRFAGYLTPPLTTVRAPTELVGRFAASQLIDLIHSQPVKMLTLLPTEIVLRRSCGCNR